MAGTAADASDDVIDVIDAEPIALFSDATDGTEEEAVATASGAQLSGAGNVIAVQAEATALYCKVRRACRGIMGHRAWRLVAFRRRHLTCVASCLFLVPLDSSHRRVPFSGRDCAGGPSRRRGNSYAGNSDLGRICGGGYDEG